jgi:hypothetical protein
VDLAGGNPLFAREVTISAVETFKHSVVPNIDSAFDAEVLQTFKPCPFPTFFRGICCFALSYDSNLSSLLPLLLSSSTLSLFSSSLHCSSMPLFYRPTRKLPSHMSSTLSDPDTALKRSYHSALTACPLPINWC